MEKRTRLRITDMLLGPFFLGLFFVFEVAYKDIFSWWYDPWRQGKANRLLWGDVQSNFYFLTSRGKLVREKPVHIHPFDYASIRLVFDNLSFRFTRGQRELNISLAPSSAPEDSHHLDCVIAALDDRGVAEIASIGDLYEAANLVRPRLDALNEAFSDTKYPEFRKKLCVEREAERIRTRQVEWELNQSLSGNRMPRS